jgi:hypothetical protein
MSATFTKSGKAPARMNRPTTENAILSIFAKEVSDLFSGTVDLKMEEASNDAAYHKNIAQRPSQRYLKFLHVFPFPIERGRGYFGI